MKNEIKISVIIPCYQVEQYIEDSVTSVRNQLFDDFEIIIVDDGTKDQSVELAEKVLNGFPYYTILHKENGGLSSARNNGIKVAKGKYVCVIDSDDIIAPTHLKDLYDLCESKRLNVSFSLFESTSEDNRQGTKEETASPTVIGRASLMKNAMDRKLMIHCCSLLINRDFLLKNILFFIDFLKFAEDTEYRWRLFPKLDKIGCTNKATYKYLTRSNSLMTTQNVDRVLIALEEIDKTIKNNQTEYSKDKRIWNLLPQRIFLSLCRGFARAASYSTFQELIKKSNRKIDLSFIIHYKDTKVKMLAIAFVVSKKLFYRISKYK